MRGNFHFDNVRTCNYLKLWTVVKDNLQYLAVFSVSRSDLLKVMASGGITLNFLRGPKAKSVMAVNASRKNFIAGFISLEKMHYGIDEIFLLRDPFRNFWHWDDCIPSWV